MKTGRPIEFDPETALDKAMILFWTQGYKTTSTTDLMNTMGLSKSSLYQSFGSKRELFIRCLNRYCQQSIEHQRSKLADVKPGKQYLIELFKNLININKNKDIPKGCMLVNTACEFGDIDKELSTFVESRLEMTRQMFQKVIEVGQSAGEIPNDKNAEHLSSLLVVSSFGLRVMAKLDIDRSVLEPIVDQILAQLD